MSDTVESGAARAAIACDSSVDLDAASLSAAGLAAAAVGYALGASHRRQGEQTLAEFYDAVAAGEALSISGVASEDWEALFGEIGSAETPVLCLTQAFGSHAPSFDAAEYASRRVEHFHQVSVRVHQTPRSTAAAAAIALTLAEAARGGASLEELEAALDEISPSADAYFIASDLDQLERSGELAAVQSQSGLGAFDFSVPLFRARDRLKAVSLHDDPSGAEDDLLERAAAALEGRPATVVVTHALNPEAAAGLAEKARAALDVHDLQVTELGPTVGGLLGRGAWGLGFCRTPSGAGGI